MREDDLVPTSSLLEDDDLVPRESCNGADSRPRPDLVPTSSPVPEPTSSRSALSPPGERIGEDEVVEIEKPLLSDEERQREFDRRYPRRRPEAT